AVLLYYVDDAVGLYDAGRGRRIDPASDSVMHKRAKYLLMRHAPFIFCGRYSAISGKITNSTTAIASRMKNGTVERAMLKISLPVSDCSPKRLNPTGGVICAISHTMTT